MFERIRGAAVIIVLGAAVFILGIINSRSLPLNTQPVQESTGSTASQLIQLREKRLSCFNVDEKTLRHALAYARHYKLDAPPAALVVPHHMTAATLVSGAFEAASRDVEYDSVVIIAPNHSSDVADVILTDKDWQTGEGVDCDIPLLEALTKDWNSSASYAFDDKKMEEDHSASSLIPFVGEYFKGAVVLPVLLSKTLTMDEALELADSLHGIITGSGKRVLLVCSIDFSHYLTAEQSRERDRQTLEAIERRDYGEIQSFTNDNLDSPASLIVFLRYLELESKSASVLDNTETSAFTDLPVQSTTSYFVLAG